MARKSRWQQFTDNFNGVYGAFNKIGQDIETQKLMDDKQFTAEGAAGYGLSGNALEKARYKALSNIYTKYGNAKDGLATRQQLSSLEASDRKNELEAATLEERIKQNGLLQSLLVRSQTGQNNATSANLDARTARTTALTPGLVTAQDLANATAQQGYELGQATFGDKVGLSAAKLASLQDANRLNDETFGDRVAMSKAGVEGAKLANQGAKIDNQQSAFNLGLDQQLADSTVMSAEAAARVAQVEADYAPQVAEMSISQAATELSVLNQQLNEAIQSAPHRVAALEAKVKQLNQKLRESSAKEDSAVSQAEADASAAQTAASVAEQTADSEVAATKAKNELAKVEANLGVSTAAAQHYVNLEEIKVALTNAQTAGNNANVKQMESEAFLSFAQTQANGGYTNDKEATDAFIQTVALFDPMKAQELERDYTAGQVADIAGEGAVMQAKVSRFIQSQDIHGIAEYFDELNGDNVGVVLKVDPDSGAVEMYELDHFGNKVNTYVDAENTAEAMQDLQNIATFGNATMYAETLQKRKLLKAELEKIRADTRNANTNAILNINQQAHVDAQTEFVYSKIKASTGGLSEQAKIAQEGLSDLLNNEAFLMANPKERSHMKLDYMKTFDMPGADELEVQLLWDDMTPEQQARFEAAGTN